MKKFIEVFKIGTDLCVHRVNVTGKSDRQIDKIEMGMLRNMNLNDYGTRIVCEDE